MKITGLIPATVTPFTDSGAIDFEELTRHLRQVGSASGLYGLRSTAMPARSWP